MEEILIEQLEGKLSQVIKVFWKMKSDPRPEFNRLGVPLSQELSKTFLYPPLCPHPAADVITQIEDHLRSLDGLIRNSQGREELLEAFVELKFVPLPHLRTFSKTEASMRIKAMASLKAYYLSEKKRNQTSDSQ